MSDHDDNRPGAEFGWGGLRDPQAPTPARAPSRVDDEPFDNDRESRTATLTLRRDEAVESGDTEAERLYNDLLEARRRRRGTRPLICDMADKWQRLLNSRTDNFAEQISARGKRPPPDLREQMHALACDMCEDDNLCDYPQMVNSIELVN